MGIDLAFQHLEADQGQFFLQVFRHPA
jgi:hypothetical protein